MYANQYFPDKPEAPTDVTLQTRNESSISLSWSHPDDRIDSCSVTVGDDEGDVTENCTSRTVVITNLPVAGKMYNITIIVRDSHGQESGPTIEYVKTCKYMFRPVIF